jgi:CBS domain containing-hemolysin-like protein
VPASAKVLDVLERFKERPIELALVVDEYGGFEGVVTRTDLLEAIAGDLPEHGDDTPLVREQPDGALSVDGALPVADLQQRLGLAALPEGRYHTAAGLVLALLERLPEIGDSVEWEGWKLAVSEMDGFSVRRVVVRRADTAKS